MSGAHSGHHGKPRTARQGQPGLMTRMSRSLFSAIPAYGTVTVIVLHVVGIAVQVGFGLAIMANQRAMAATPPAAPASISTTHTPKDRP